MKNLQISRVDTVTDKKAIKTAGMQRALLKHIKWPQMTAVWPCVLEK